MSNQATGVESSEVSDAAAPIIETLKKAHEIQIATLKEQHKNELTEKHWAYVRKETQAVTKILGLEHDKETQKDRIRALRMRIDQISSSAQTTIDSALDRVQKAQNEGVNAKLRVLQLETEMEEKDEKIAKLKEHIGKEQLYHALSMGE